MRQPRRTNGGGTPNRWMRSGITTDNSRSPTGSALKTMWEETTWHFNPEKRVRV
jgi:hypothetical protein